MHQRATVLLIDDDRDMRWAMRNILADAGFNVAEAGRPGLEMATCRTPDTVLLDMRMPDVGGEEVLRCLHRLDSGGLPVIVVTAHGSIAGAVSAIQDGAFEYITKPFRIEHLINTVQRAVARRSVGPPADGVRAAMNAISRVFPAATGGLVDVAALRIEQRDFDDALVEQAATSGRGRHRRSRYSSRSA